LPAEAVTTSVLDLQRIVIKFFAVNPAPADPGTFIPILHRWIQTRRVEGMLVDVADYGHLPDGPGVVLIGHEADYFLDSMEGPFGLLYSRKAPLSGSLADRIRAAFRAALVACARLEEEPEFKGTLKFKAGEPLFIANDRLLAPNTEETFAALRPELEGALRSIYGGAQVALVRDARDPRSRLTVRITTSEPVEVATLLSRIG